MTALGPQLRRPPPDEAPEDTRALAADLLGTVSGGVRFDSIARILYSTDASNYQIEPLGVVHPLDADDVVATIETCVRHDVPVVPRCAGTSLAGQAIGPGIILDFTPFMADVHVDPQRRIARVQPGVVLDQLNHVAGAHGLCFGPDPASSDRACIAGIVANNATGAHSIVHGTSADHLRAVDAVLADGSQTRLAPVPASAIRHRIRAGGLEGRVLETLLRIVTTQSQLIEDRFPRYWRRAGGYNLDRLVRSWAAGEELDTAALFAGSEGTLAVATELEVQLVATPRHRALLLAHFDDALDPYRAVPALLQTSPSAIELVDRVLIEHAREAPGYAADVGVVVGDPAALLIVEYAGDSSGAVAHALAEGARVLERGGYRGPHLEATTEEGQDRIWRVRKAGLGLLMRMRGDWKPVPGIEDAAVPPDRLATYMTEVGRLLGQLDIRAAYYAHASAGCIHVRPIVNLKNADGVAALHSLSRAVVELATSLGGVQSSEHGDGLARGAYNRLQFGPALYSLLEEVKRAFDPDGLLNPGKVVDCPAPIDNLRFGPGYRATSLPAQFRYAADGSIAQAIEQCNGSGVCRKLDAGTMCPSFMVTGDEAQSTRARANVLRAVVDGRLPPEALTSDELWEVMELCVACKACGSECPSGVDVARLKTEVLAWRNEAHGVPLRARLFANLNRIDRAVGPVAPLANLLLSGPPAALVARALGLAPERSLPRLATESFDRWWQRRAAQPATRSDARTVVLFADTITTYHEPSIGRAAVQVLEAAGYRVVSPPRRCCGRPALSQGMIDAARRDMRYNVHTLAPLAAAGWPIVVPEPSCASVFRDEMPDLLSGSDEAEESGEAQAAIAVADAVVTLDEFVAGLPDDALRVRRGPSKAILHVHCHQRAATGPGPTIATLSRIPGLSIEEPDAGCCGMAGAFGYEAEHQAVSLAMAERRLAPAIRVAPDDASIVAPGASCRHQIADTTGRRAVHPIELLAACLSEQQG